MLSQEGFAVVIGDTVGSRLIADRDAYQQQLQSALRVVNKISRPASAYTVSAGDGIEAVYRDPRRLFVDVLSIRAAVFPQRIRFAVALGVITTALDPRNPMLADGPAFHLARSGIEWLKHEDETLCVLSEHPETVALENTAARLLAHHVERWKQTRWQVFLELTRGSPKVKIGPSLGITRVAAYKSIREGALDIVRGLAEDLGRSLVVKMGGGLRR